jgi:hypothetical protein
LIPRTKEAYYQAVLKLPAHGYGLDLAVAKSMLGKKDDAFQSLNTALTEDTVVITWIRRPEFDSLRSDPRYAALMRRMNLPRVS